MSRVSTPFSTRATRDLTRPRAALGSVASLLAIAKLGVGEADTIAGSHTVSRAESTRRRTDSPVEASRAIAFLDECCPFGLRDRILLAFVDS